MNIYILLKTILTTLLLALFISACSSNTDSNVKEKQVNAKSGERVDLVALDGDSYSWLQVSGVSVILINANTNTLSFIAPDVNETESLVFEVQVISDNGDIKKETITVTVHPLEVLDDNEKTPTDTTSSNDNNSTPTSQTDSNTTSISTSPLKSITLTISNNSLNINSTTTLNAIATYEDKTTKDVTEEVEWIATDLNAIEINKHQITAKKEKNIILQAKLNAIISNTIALEIYQEINGHRLPPEPNKAINDSTLLGIDVNNNGVRDDVERWVYETYTEPVEIGIFMQSARAFQKVIVDPSKAHETTTHIDNSYSCNKYMLNNNIQLYKKYEYVEMDKELEKNQFNSIKRHMAYERFNAEFSGEVFSAPKASKEKCAFDENGILRN